MSQTAPYRTIETKDLVRSNCATCGSAAIQPHILLSREGAPPGAPEHNIVYEHAVVVRCTACESGFVEIRTHDCFDFEEVWDQNEWYVFDRASGDVLKSKTSECPSLLSETCRCPLHESLRSVQLPVTHWTYGFEADSHIHSIEIILRRNLPQFGPPSA